MQKVIRKTGVILALILAAASAPPRATAQIPRDQLHVSLTLGGYVLFGLGYTHWMEEHHALEFTAFPFGYPGEQFPFAARAGYIWVPSDEVWRAKLGGNFTLLFHPRRGQESLVTPLLTFTPGIQYNPESEKSLRMDVWMSYYLTEKVFAPTSLEFLYGWSK
ncbi:hypothetical protein ACFL3S_12960 [Gemmatimonadota bacterium]